MREVFTIGHSTRTQDEFLLELRRYGIECVVDVRSYPGSRREPQFGKDTMRTWLRDAAVDYVHLPGLGGRRGRQAGVSEDVNAAWNSASFRNYADYTLSDEFERGVRDLEFLALSMPVAFMCAEAVPWQCHRSILSSVLVARGWAVWHVGLGSSTLHELGKWGPVPVVTGDRVTYPATGRSE